MADFIHIKERRSGIALSATGKQWEDRIANVPSVSQEGENDKLPAVKDYVPENRRRTDKNKLH